MKSTIHQLVKKNTAAAIFIGIAIGVLFLNILISNLNLVTFKSRAVGEAVALTFSPSSVTVSPGATFTVQLRIKPSIDMNVRGYAFPIIFNKNELEVTNITYNVGSASPGLGHTAAHISIVNTNGVIKAIGEFTSSTGQLLSSSSNTTLMTIVLKAKSFTTTSVTVNRSLAQIYMIDSSREFALAQLSAAANATVTVTQISNTPSITPGAPTITPVKPTATPVKPTVTPVRPTVTPQVPTTTPAQTTCSCDSIACSPQCVFDKHGSLPSGVSYANPMKCALAGSLFSSAPNNTSQQAWCNRNLRTRGDADGNGGVDRIDYLYYVQAVNGGQIPSGVNSSVNVNPDFNGDGEIGASDRAVVIIDLGQN